MGLAIQATMQAPTTTVEDEEGEATTAVGKEKAALGAAAVEEAARAMGAAVYSEAVIREGRRAAAAGTARIIPL